MTTTKIDRAAKHLDATKLASGDWAHYADETSTWYVVSEGDLADLCDYLDDEDEQVSGDAYSHWCAGTVSSEATPAQIAEITGEKLPEVKINVYRHVSEGGAWCFAMWVDGRFDSSDTLDCDDDATDAEAIEYARTMPLTVAGSRTVARVEDC